MGYRRVGIMLQNWIYEKKLQHKIQPPPPCTCPIFEILARIYLNRWGKPFIFFKLSSILSTLLEPLIWPLIVNSHSFKIIKKLPHYQVWSAVARVASFFLFWRSFWQFCFLLCAGSSPVAGCETFQLLNNFLFLLENLF